MKCCCQTFGPSTRKFTADEAKLIGGGLGVDWRAIDIEQFRKGLEVELEHGCRDPQTNITCDDVLLTGMIALAHIKEIPDYYTKLKEMEEKTGGQDG